MYWRNNLGLYFLSLVLTVEALEKLAEENIMKADGHVCVINSDCNSKCCLYATAVSGRCIPKAPVGRVCGFVLGTGNSVGDHYRLCENCDTYCCCGSGCCPTVYCVAALELKPVVCTNCNTGCCCNDDTCCPVPYCAVSPDLHQIQGEPCQRCPSGCCCGDSCCLSTFCKGTIIGNVCPTCGSGCCCGKFCCASSFCDGSAMSLTRLLSLYVGGPGLPAQTPFDPTSLAYMNPAEVNRAFAQRAAISGYFPAVIGGAIGSQRPIIRGLPCLDCTTGCCCAFGCCNNIYC